MRVIFKTVPFDDINRSLESIARVVEDNTDRNILGRPVQHKLALNGIPLLFESSTSKIEQGTLESPTIITHTFFEYTNSKKEVIHTWGGNLWVVFDQKHIIEVGVQEDGVRGYDPVKVLGYRKPSDYHFLKLLAAAQRKITIDHRSKEVVVAGRDYKDPISIFVESFVSMIILFKKRRSSIRQWSLALRRGDPRLANGIPKSRPEAVFFLRWGILRGIWDMYDNTNPLTTL